MLKLYKEHPEFDEFTKFDTETGRLLKISEEEFRKSLPDDFADVEAQKGIKRIEGKGATIFLGETPETHTRFPRRIYFQITRNCNLNCPACFIKAEKGGAHVPTDAIMKLIPFLSRNGLMEVRITGGEPTSHPDFLKIIHKFQEEGVYVSVATNGVISQKTLEALCKGKNLWLICSIDGNRATHNKYRPNTFDIIIRNLKYLKEKNPSIRLRLTTILTKENKDQMFELAEITRSIGAESITIIPLRPQLREQTMKNEMITGEEFKGVIKSLIQAKKKFGIQFTTTIETDYKKDIRCDPIFRKKSSCAAGREGTNLDYDAKRDEFLVYGCSYSPASDLNANMTIRKPFLAGMFSPDNVSAFLDIWKDESAWTIFRDLSLKSNDCKDCSYLKNHLCGGSCPIQNVDYSTIVADKDVLGQLRDQIMHTGEWYCYKKIA
ncbi:MAG: radical SAM protein [Nanoarchaeota archaeon]|nr:radical SAM protein [Nanoarchaeota archaeon]